MTNCYNYLYEGTYFISHICNHEFEIIVNYEISSSLEIVKVEKFKNCNEKRIFYKQTKIEKFLKPYSKVTARLESKRNNFIRSPKKNYKKF